MATIRTRLTLAYAVALAATMGVYSWALYEMRSERSNEPMRRLMVSQADLAIRVLTGVLRPDSGQIGFCKLLSARKRVD